MANPTISGPGHISSLQARGKQPGGHTSSSSSLGDFESRLGRVADGMADRLDHAGADAGVMLAELGY